MLFWIMIAVWVIGIVGATYKAGTMFNGGGAYAWRKSFDWGDSTVGMFAGFFLVGIGVALLYFGITVPVWGSHHVTEQHETRSVLLNIGDNHAQRGRLHGGLFLAYGTIDGERTINYVSQQDGYATLGQVYSYEARVFEGEENPSMSRYDYEQHNYWLYPWKINGGVSYDFRVPAGTISSQFAIGNGGTDDTSGD